MKRRLNIIRLWAMLTTIATPWGHITAIFQNPFREDSSDGGYPLGVVVKSLHGGRGALVPYSTRPLYKARMDSWIRRMQARTGLSPHDLNVMCRLWAMNRPMPVYYKQFHPQMNFLEKGLFHVYRKIYQRRYQ